MNQLSTPVINKATEFFQQDIKSLQQSSSPKALGGSQNTSLASWYEEAHAYYQKVQSGQETMPDVSTWNEFLNQMRWAYDQLMVQSGPVWDPMAFQSASPDLPGETQVDPFGGTRGTHNNWTHTHEKTEIGFTGEERRDIWSNEIDLDIAPLSAQVQVVKVMDENIEPPEEVLKVLVKDGATGTQATWVIHDYQDAQIRINVPDVEDQVEDLTELNPSPFTVAKFEEGSLAPKNPVANIPGTPLEDRENATLYEGYADERVEFRLEPYGVDGEVQTHVVYGDTSIFTRPTDEVAVTQGENGETLVTVTHRDGSQDILEVQEGYDVQVFAREETLTLDGQDFGSLENIPEAYGELLSINPNEPLGEGQNELFSEEDLNSENDSADKIEDGIAYYNTQDFVSLETSYEGEIKEYNVTTDGTFELSANNYEDEVDVYLLPNGSYHIIVSNPAFGENEGAINYIVKGPPEQILLQGFLPNQVNVIRSGVTIYNFGEGEQGNSQFKEEDFEIVDRIRMDSNNAVYPSSETELNEEENENIQRVDHFLEAAGKNWDQLLAAIRAAGFGSYADVEDLKGDVREGHFPYFLGANGSPEMMGRIVQVLYNLDSEFRSGVLGANKWESGVLSSQYHQAAERLVYLLTALYPQNNISLNLNQPVPTQWWRNNEIVIDGTSFNFTSSKKGQTNILEFSEAEVNEPHPG